MSKQLKIALDIDGVLADSMMLWTRVFNQTYSRHLTTSQMGTWNFWSELGLTRRQFQEIFTKIWEDWTHLPPTEPEISEKVRRLSQYGGIDIVTGRTEDTAEYAEKWLSMQKVPYGKLYLMPGNTTKLDSGHDIYVDDSPLIASEAPVVQRKILLYNQPWNRCVRNNHYVTRVSSLDDAATVLSSISNKPRE
ncbi:MAG: hypothetical protein HYU39_05445 [Thaumarchaeota archaeon]|nr:hypothetical protein [Nitrososphaerota archaeon]